MSSNNLKQEMQPNNKDNTQELGIDLKVEEMETALEDNKNCFEQPKVNEDDSDQTESVNTDLDRSDNEDMDMDVNDNADTVDDKNDDTSPGIEQERPAKEIIKIVNTEAMLNGEEEAIVKVEIDETDDYTAEVDEGIEEATFDTLEEHLHHVKVKEHLKVPLAEQSKSNNVDKAKNLVLDCPCCPHINISGLEYRNHIKEHAKEQVHTCYKCLQHFDTFHEHLVHAEEHLLEPIPDPKKRSHKVDPVSNILFDCPCCHWTNIKHLNYLGHMQQHAVEVPQKCFKCSLTFDSFYERLLHSESHKSEPREVGNCYLFDCPCCNLTNINHVVYILHIQEHALEKHHRCYKCSQTFDSFYEHLLHAQSHIPKTTDTNDSEKNNLQSNLKNEQMKKALPSNRNQEEYGCAFCDKTFTNKKSYFQHFPSHFMNQAALSDVDNTSQIASKQVISISESVGKQKGNIHENVYKCAFCPKCFTTNWDFTVHMREHDAQKLFKCDKCDLSFSIKSHLREHKAYRHNKPRVTLIDKVKGQQHQEIASTDPLEKLNEIPAETSSAHLDDAYSRSSTTSTITSSDGNPDPADVPVPEIDNDKPPLKTRPFVVPVEIDNDKPPLKTRPVDEILKDNVEDHKSKSVSTIAAEMAILYEELGQLDKEREILVKRKERNDKLFSYKKRKMKQSIGSYQNDGTDMDVVDIQDEDSSESDMYNKQYEVPVSNLDNVTPKSDMATLSIEAGLRDNDIINMYNLKPQSSLNEMEASVQPIKKYETVDEFKSDDRNETVDELIEIVDTTYETKPDNFKSGDATSIMIDSNSSDEGEDDNALCTSLKSVDHNEADRGLLRYCIKCGVVMSGVMETKAHLESENIEPDDVAQLKQWEDALDSAKESITGILLFMFHKYFENKAKMNCYFCRHWLETGTEFIQHMKVVHPTRFTNVAVVHKKKKVQNDNQVCMCLFCGVEMAKIKPMMVHYRNEHGITNEYHLRKYIICSAGYTKKKRNIRCDLCMTDVHLKNSDLLIKHMRENHLNIENDDGVVLISKIHTKKTKAINKHLRTQIICRKWKAGLQKNCDVCGLKFFDEDHYQKHIKTHKVEQGNNPEFPHFLKGSEHFICSMCGLKFFDEKHFLKHMFTHRMSSMKISEIEKENLLKKYEEKIGIINSSDYDYIDKEKDKPHMFVRTKDDVKGKKDKGVKVVALPPEGFVQDLVKPAMDKSETVTDKQLFEMATGKATDLKDNLIANSSVIDKLIIVQSKLNKSTVILKVPDNLDENPKPGESVPVQTNLPEINAASRLEVIDFYCCEGCGVKFNTSQSLLNHLLSQYHMLEHFNKVKMKTFKAIGRFPLFPKEGLISTDVAKQSIAVDDILKSMFKLSELITQYENPGVITDLKMDHEEVADCVKCTTRYLCSKHSLVKNILSCILVPQSKQPVAKPRQSMDKPPAILDSGRARPGSPTDIVVIQDETDTVTSDDVTTPSIEMDINESVINEKHVEEKKLSKDEKEKNAKEKKVYTCFECDKTFKLGHHLKEHKITHTKTHPNVCECGARFTHSGSLSNHRKWANCGYLAVGAVKKDVDKTELAEKDDEIDIDESVENEKDEEEKILDNDEVNVTEKNDNKKRLYTCSECYKTFKSRANLKEHEISHTNVYAHVCECGLKFKHLGSLRNHKISGKCYLAVFVVTKDDETTVTSEVAEKDVDLNDTTEV